MGGVRSFTRSAATMLVFGPAMIHDSLRGEFLIRPGEQPVNLEEMG